MRVVVVCPWPPWRTSDGVVLVLDQHLRRLASRHEIVVLAASSRHRSERRLVGTAAGLPDGVPLRWFGTPMPAAVDYIRRRIRSELTGEPAHVHFVQRRDLLSALRQEAAHADLVYLVGWGTAQLADAVAPRPAVHFAVDPWAANLANRRLPWWRRIADAGQHRKVVRHERRHYPNARAVVLVSDDDERLLSETISGARFATVANGVDAGPCPSPLPDRPVLGFHGSWGNQHNVDAAHALVDRILPAVQRDVPRARVLLFGRDPTADVWGLAGPSVEVLGSVPEVRSHLERIQVYVAWMTSGFGIKNKVLEAMAAARPVVADAKGASGIGASSGLFVAGDEEGAAAKVVALLRDPAAAAAAGAANRDRVQREFTWDVSADRLEAIWLSALS